jgi:hypothetical protein
MGCTGAPIIEVLRDADPFDGFYLTSAACPECVKSHGTEPQARIASCALRRPTLLSDMFTANFGNLLQNSGKLGDIHRDPARLTAQADIETAPRASAALKRWQNTAMALRWTAAGILEATKGFRRLKAYKHLPALRAALSVHQSKCVSKRVEDNADVA